MNSTAELYARDFSALRWRKSSRSHDDEPPDNCVLVGVFPDGAVAVSDSKNRDAKPLVYTPDEWAAFTAGVRDGEFG
ncbi:MAG: DUF397 domain-containing protein [Pseudonocardiaceae bacterium]